MPDAMVAHDSGVLWDVVEEHLNELEFGVEQIERNLESSLFAIDHLARKIEPRFAAHLDGLAVGGEPVLRRLLVPSIDELAPNEPARVAAVAAALTALGAYENLLPALFHEEAAVRRATVRGAVLVGDANLDHWALALSGKVKEPTHRAALTDLLAGRGMEPPWLSESLQSGAGVLVAAAARATLVGDVVRFLPILETLTQSVDRGVRDAAIVAALACGSVHAWYACEQAAFDAKEVDPGAMVLCATLGSPSTHARLAELSQRKSHRLAALFALGHSGNASQIPFLLRVIASNDEIEAKVAAQAVSTIVGIDLGDERFAQPVDGVDEPADAPRERGESEEPAANESDTDTLPPLEEEPENLVPIPEEALPNPNADAFFRYWAEVAPRFTKPCRYIGGRPLDADSALDYMTRAPMRRIHAVGLAMRIRSGGRAWIDTCAASVTQRAQIASARAIEQSALFRHWAGW